MVLQVLFTREEDAALNALLAATLRPISFRRPLRLTAISAWDEHIPFAMALVDLLRPRTLVELGTHAGDSYCAFCQAVAELSSDTRCYAVDTWRGDGHAGEFGDEVLAELRAHHDPLYGGFSRLVQSTFEDASRYFDDGAVDLLHIDGFHTFEAVKQDFESWLPKMTPQGVVLFHDTNVRERDFGVWKLWRELSGRYPHFEFAHAHGLGVLAVGDPPDALRPLFSAVPDEAAMVRLVFAELGRRLTAEKALVAGEAEQRELGRSLRERERDVAELRGAVAAELARAEEAEARLREVETSRAWQAIQRYRALRDRVVPQGSTGRRLYEGALRRKR
jgi:predicted O-methyltransferase YrrM